MTNFENISYEHLNHLQVGKIGEYWAKIFLTLKGYDVYTTDVDNKGIDFIVRTDNENHLDIQVKTIRQNSGYVYITKDTWKNELRQNLFLILVQLNDFQIPRVYYIPSTVWNNPTDLFTDKNYDKEGQKSKPEWGINISKKNMTQLEKYEISKKIK